MQKGKAPSGLTNSRKQQDITAYRTDYWMVQELLDKTTNPDLRRAYAILSGLINSKLSELEK